jgi:hypothetical protein
MHSSLLLTCTAIPPRVREDFVAETVRIAALALAVSGWCLAGMLMTGFGSLAVAGANGAPTAATPMRMQPIPAIMRTAALVNHRAILVNVRADGGSGHLMPVQPSSPAAATAIPVVQASAAVADLVGDGARPRLPLQPIF